VHTKFNGFEIMYHVAPYLPWYPNDKQQLERKRHLGNDIVVIVFQVPSA
jgi:RAP1 GTPase activating protein 1